MLCERGSFSLSLTTSPAPPYRLQEFPNGGTTNGANWYPIYGSMQDWNYVVGHCLELTLELRWDGAGPGRERWM